MLSDFYFFIFYKERNQRDLVTNAPNTGSLDANLNPHLCDSSWSQHPSTSLCLACMLSHVWLFTTLLDWSLPGSSTQGVFQARVLEQVVIFFSRGFSCPRDRTHVSWVSCVAGGFFTRWAIGKVSVGRKQGGALWLGKKPVTKVVEPYMTSVWQILLWKKKKKDFLGCIRFLIIWKWTVWRHVVRVLGVGTCGWYYFHSLWFFFFFPNVKLNLEASQYCPL